MIETKHLFDPLDQLLIQVLSSLSADDWQRPTVAGSWRVKDIASHLLDGNLRAISMLQDGYFGEQPGPINSYQDMVNFLNRLNADWTTATRRLSPALMTELLARSGPKYFKVINALDPQAPALFSVGWAGEDQSLNWMHIARDYTEKWHHQAQIRLAIHQLDPILTDEFYDPYLHVSLLGLPHHYRTIPGKEGQTIHLIIEKENPLNRFLIRADDHWVLSNKREQEVDCTIYIDGSIAWRLFTKGISRKAAEKKVRIEGNPLLGTPIFDLTAVMA
ncbi:MAG: maleylpyruvate isomerase N-terminal domain-containing protein [Bacteroidota bacterium]